MGPGALNQLGCQEVKRDSLLGPAHLPDGGLGFIMQIGLGLSP